MDIGIGGMTCASWVAHVEKTIKKVPGVHNASVNLTTESTRIAFVASDAMEARLRRAVLAMKPAPQMQPLPMPMVTVGWLHAGRRRCTACKGLH